MKRALKIEVPAREVTQRFSRAYAELNRQVNMPGFRPGKVPLAILEKRYAKAVEEDVIRSLVPDSTTRPSASGNRAGARRNSPVGPSED